MASGSQNMTTYNARIVTGSNSAASPAGALLLSGAGRADDATGDTWIFLNSLGGLTNPWGIKHDEANNKLQIFGSGTNSFSVRMDTGDTYILGKVGIGYDPGTSGNTYKLYVDGSTRINSTLHIFPNSENYTEGIRIHSYNSWSDIILCGNDNTGDTNISANSWFIGNNNGNFYIARNGSPGSTAWLECVNNIWSTMNPLWIKGGSTEAGADANRLTTTSGMPGNMQYNASRRGTQIYSNGIAFADPYNGNSNSDAGWIRQVETTGNTGYLEIGVGDDGNEEIIVSQYKTDNTVGRQMYLLNSAGFTTVSNQSTDSSYAHAAMQIREANYAGASSDTWGVAPRLAWHWSGRVAAQIGLASNGYLYEAPATGTSFYKLVYESGTWGISISGNATTATTASNLKSTHAAGFSTDAYCNFKHQRNTNTDYWQIQNNAGTAKFSVYFETGQVTATGPIVTSFKSGYAMCAYGSTQTTVANLLGELRYSNGATGSANLSAYTGTAGGSIAAGWYNFFYSPHRVGGLNGAANSDNANYGSCILSGMTVASQLWYIRYSSSAIAESRRIWMAGNSVTSAVWNDYAEARESLCTEPGRTVQETGFDTLAIITERLAPCAGIISDTWGFSQGETDGAKTHIAVAGRVLAYPYRNRDEYKSGDVLCAAPNGTVDIMTREEVIQYPDRIVGTVSCVPEYEEWGGGENADRPPVKVNGRIWVKVK